MQYNADTIRKISPTARMLIAMICFERYCIYHGITSNETDEIIDHMWSYLYVKTGDDYSRWIDGIDSLAFDPLGEKFPVEYMNRLPTAIQGEFKYLITECIEVHATCWYAGDSELSVKALFNVIDVISRYHISLPCITYFIQRFPGDSKGVFANDEEIESFRATVTQSSNNTSNDSEL